MSRTDKDRIYANRQDKVKDFVFDENVTSVFADMIQRSVPGYSTLNQVLPIVANQFLKNNSNVYDLGCSLGEASISIAKSKAEHKIKIHAVDNSKAMINQLLQRIKKLNLDEVIDVIVSDVLKTEINNASFVILNYTLQFVDRSQRDMLINKIYSGLNNDGALLLSEKNYV